MARRNGIIVSSEPGGRFSEGFLATGLTVYPGSIVQLDPSVSLVGGRHTYVVYNADADGGRPKGPYYVVLEDALQGRTATDSIASGSGTARLFLYTPVAGDELNLLLANIAGTADDHTAGEMLIVDDTTGKMIATTGSPETEVAMLLETITDPTADQLVWCQWTGY